MLIWLVGESRVTWPETDGRYSKLPRRSNAVRAESPPYHLRLFANAPLQGPQAFDDAPMVAVRDPPLEILLGPGLVAGVALDLVDEELHLSLWGIPLHLREDAVEGLLGDESPVHLDLAVVRDDGPRSRLTPDGCDGHRSLAQERMAGQALVLLFQPVYDGGHRVEGVLAQLGHAGVARDAPGDHPEHAPASLADAELQIRGLPQDACVWFEFILLDYLSRGHALIGLLVDNEGEDDLTGQVRCGTAVDHSCEGALHVNSSPAMQDSVHDLRGIWRVVPALEGARLDVVEVPVEQNRPPALPAAPCHDVPHLVHGDTITKISQFIGDYPGKLLLLP